MNSYVSITATPGPTKSLLVKDCLRDGWVGVCEVGPGGARIVKQGASLEPVRNGFVCGHGPATWTLDGGFQVWSENAIVAISTSDGFNLGGLDVKSLEVAEVVSFIEDEDLGHRGVFLILKTGDRVRVLEEHDDTAQLDPTYNMDNARIDGAWARFLGRDLATWLGVPHRTES